ncbi:hypothetical protein QQ045_022521 [Rhodiola kirilowii]
MCSIRGLLWYSNISGDYKQGRYGSVMEIWFDGAKGANGKNMTYYFEDWFGMVKELQGSINIFSDAGLGIRWVGEEKGFSGINQSSLSIGNESIATNYLVIMINNLPIRCSILKLSLEHIFVLGADTYRPGIRRGPTGCPLNVMF